MLAYFFKQAPTAPAQLERIIAYPVQWKKINSIFNFAITEMRGEPMAVDSRWEVERKIVLVDQTRISLGGSGAPIENLREMLSQMGFQLNIPDMTQVNNALNALREEKVAIERGSLAQYGLPKKYAIDASPYTINFDGSPYTLEMYPANAKPNLNYMDEEDLDRYLQWLGIDKKDSLRMAQLIVDFRDRDTSALGGNTEGPFQTDSRFITRFMNEDIGRIDVLSYIPGFDSSVVNFLRKNFNWHGNDARINYKYNTKEAIAAYTDLRPELVAAALEYERQKNDPLYTETLQGLLGTDEAEIWKSKVTDEYIQTEPVHMILKDKTIQLHAIYYPERKKIVEVYVQ